MEEINGKKMGNVSEAVASKREVMNEWIMYVLKSHQKSYIIL